MAGFASTVYNSLFRYNQVYLGAIFISAFGLEMGLTVGGDRIWDYINKGRQWKDIKAKYVVKEDDDE